MHASPTFHTLRNSAEVDDNYDFGTINSNVGVHQKQGVDASPSQEFSMVEQQEKLHDEADKSPTKQWPEKAGGQH